MKENIWGPLGITDITFWPESNPDLKERSAHMFARNNEGNAIHVGGISITAGSKDSFGGHGACGTPQDFFKVVGSLLMDDEKLLKKETARAMFQP